MRYKLVKQLDGQLVNFGDKVLTRRGDLVEVIGTEDPKKVGSEGYVYVMYGGNESSRVFFPSDVGCKLVNV